MMFWDAFWATVGVGMGIVFVVALLGFIGLLIFILAELTVRFIQWRISRRNQIP